MGRIWALAALAAGIWLLNAYGRSQPQALGLEAPATQFSAARADAVLSRILGDERPHPAGSAENAAVRDRILKELADLGVPARMQTQMSCYGEDRWGAISCGTVNNIIASVAPGQGKEILLMAHGDSVAAGPGAGDDASGVATILESIRALKARNLPPGHPIIALFTDGEENGLLGAAAYLRDPMARARTGAVINMEARGNQGPSHLFQTGAGDARLIGIYARAVPHYAASSLYAEIYKYLPNDTDMSPFLAAGLTGYNFAFIGNAAQYHTPLDRRENIDPRTLQQHGDNLLGLTDALSHADLAGLKSGNAIYLDVLGRWLPRLPQSWSLPLSIAAFVLIALTGWRRERQTIKPWLAAALMPLLLLSGCIGIGFLLHGLAAWISGNADPSFAFPLRLRLSLSFGVFAMALLVAGRAGAIACWLWLAGLAILCAIWAPGLTPYFLFPALVAASLLWARARNLALFIAALAGLVIWLGLNQGGEAIMGLRLHPLFTVTAAFALLPLLPLLTAAKGKGPAAVLSLVLAVGLAVAAGLQPAYSRFAPQRLNLRYVESAGKAWWLADPVPRLPQSLRAAAQFSPVPRRMVETGYVAPAGVARYPAPSASVTRLGDIVTLDLKAEGDGVVLDVPADAKLRAATVGGITVLEHEKRTAIVCSTPDCGSVRMILRLGSSRPVMLDLRAYRSGLPPEGAKLLAARASLAVPSQGGDRTVLAAKIAIPAR
ncbi:MAG TPA: M20/M25/M40 family metallo-hydrolase [Rhizomicrobium sp.]|nr:M20/M25/M40 family metallo-hydrolase [Rhizomicrobium sp.]